MNKVRDTLNEVEGVENAEVDFANSTATVKVAPGDFSADDAISALADNGYAAELQ